MAQVDSYNEGGPAANTRTHDSWMTGLAKELESKMSQGTSASGTADLLPKSVFVAHEGVSSEFKCTDVDGMDATYVGGAEDQFKFKVHVHGPMPFSITVS